MTKTPMRGVPQKLEAAHLSDNAFLRATQLLKEMRAENPSTPFSIACDQALRQSWIEDRRARCGGRDAT